MWEIKTNESLAKASFEFSNTVPSQNFPGFVDTWY